MAKSQEQIEARLLRKKGRSLKEIARLLEVSKSSASIWCCSVKLIPQQIENLHKQMVVGGYRGRLKGAQLQKVRREQKISRYAIEGKKVAALLNNHNLLFLGLGLYMGEGRKGGNRF